MSEAQALGCAREALRQGNKTAAREILVPLLRSNSRSEIGWLLMSVAVDDPSKERDCLQMVLRVNPNNEIAQRHLDRLAQAGTPSTGEEPAPAIKKRLVPRPVQVLIAVLVGLAVIVCACPVVLGLLGTESRLWQKECHVRHHMPQGGNPGALDVIFSVQVTPSRAEETLRLEWDRYVERNTPKSDYLLAAWHTATGNDLDGEVIPLTDGSKSLVYYRETNRLMTWKEYEEMTELYPWR